MGGMTFIWRIASDFPAELIAGCEAAGSNIAQLRRAEMLLEAPALRFSFAGSASQLRALEYLPNSAALPVVCSEVAGMISMVCGETVQMFPVEVACEGSVQCWVLLNPVRKVEAVDWAATDALLIPGSKQVMKFRTLKLLPSALGDLDVARLDEFSPFILVSERFRGLFVNEAGCEFVEPVAVHP